MTEFKKWLLDQYPSNGIVRVSGLVSNPRLTTVNIDGRLVRILENIELSMDSRRLGFFYNEYEPDSQILSDLKATYQYLKP